MEVLSAQTGMLHDHLITVDVDWASDSVIAEVANYMISNKIRSTWFITHDSPEISRILSHPDLFEVGIHPNFLKGSDQGRNSREIMRNLLKIAPEARSMRTHSLVQSTPLLRMAKEEFRIEHDVSLFLPNTPNIIPHQFFVSKSSGLVRIPYFWEDDAETLSPNPCFLLSDSRYHVDGIKIFNFHPIHIVLNSCDLENYLLCRSELEIADCDVSDLQPYVNRTRDGAGEFFRDLIQLVKDRSGSSGLTISDLVHKWRSLNERSGT